MINIQYIATILPGNIDRRKPPIVAEMGGIHVSTKAPVSQLFLGVGPRVL
jgi:hypothetical protein